MKKSIRIPLFLHGIGILAASSAWALPEDPGPYAVQKQTLTQPIAGKSVTFDLYLPQGLGTPAPIVAVGHGFQRSRANMAGWGDQLARRGLIAAVPDFPGGFAPDHPLNGKILAGLLHWMDSESQQPGSSLTGRVDGTRRAVMGYSAGGLAAVLAAAGDSSISLVVGLDPVDSAGLGQQAAPNVKATVVFVRGEPGQCNANGNAADIFAALTTPSVSLLVDGATHCDPESPSGALCELFCGSRLQARHMLFRRYALAAVDLQLLCDSSVAPWLGGNLAQSDPGVKQLQVSASPPSPGTGCTTPKADAGAPAPDASPAHDGGVVADSTPASQDSGLAPDGGATGQDGSSTNQTPTPDGQGGGGCRVGGSGSAPAALLPLIALLVLGRLRRSTAP